MKGIACVLEGFGSARVNDPERAVEEGEEARDRVDGPQVRGADHRVGRRVEVGDPRAFPEELRAHGDGHVRSRGL